jgi:hypothetical protein
VNRTGRNCKRYFLELPTAIFAEHSLLALALCVSLKSMSLNWQEKSCIIAAAHVKPAEKY